ncbi:hypothetical protein PQI07_22665 [Methylobacterium sp. 092160098-2]|uniref:hypothetical protein n=1 Tax=Methylobacterium sp. 092160098-2 TaxID=3025129 RepID=UPI002381C88F|nr:hypothetical protein [Methylobacterium sp. 092160098-2]MDE4913487.1 hypothetical protein [Methylobacterium sp. 092160098-2]
MMAFMERGSNMWLVHVNGVPGNYVVAYNHAEAIDTARKLYGKNGEAIVVSHVSSVIHTDN